MSQNHELTLAVIGLGHVGLPTALGLAELGWNVVGVESDQTKANLIAGGSAPFFEPDVEELLIRHAGSGRFVVETDVATAVRKATVIFICVGTPQHEDGSPDLSQLEVVAGDIASALNDYKIIVQKSTAPVNTAEYIRQNILCHSNTNNFASTEEPFKVDFDMTVNPEFLREGMAVQDFLNPDRIVLGVDTKHSEEILLDIYRPLVESMGKTIESVVMVTDIKTAEIIKHASNAFLASKASFANMVADLCEVTGANVSDVALGIGKDPRIGTQYLKAGVGYGGGCLPKDIRAFTWIASQHGVDFSMLEEVVRINQRRTDVFLSKMRMALGGLDGKKIAVWGLAFKPGTDDIREAPSLEIVRELVNEGASLRLYDPRAMDEFRGQFAEDPPWITYCSSAEEATVGVEGLVLLTEWQEFLNVDLDKVRKCMVDPLVIDGRNYMDPSTVRSLGFKYFSVGRP